VGACSSVLEEAEALTLVEVSLSASPEPLVSPSQSKEPAARPVSQT